MFWSLSDAGLSGNGPAGTSSAGNTTGSGTAHTKGSWTVYVDPVPWPAAGIWVTHRGLNASTNDSSTLLDLGIAVSGGTADTETVLVANIPLGFYTGARGFYLPVQVPAGVRLSGRIQSAQTSKGVQVQAAVSGGGFLPGSAGARATTYGANTATSSGTVLTVPGATNTKGAWTDISASTTNPLRWMVPFTSNEPTGTVGGTTHLIDIGVGPSGSEQVLLADLAASSLSTEVFHSGIITLPVNLPAGTRIAARYQANSVSAGNRPAIVIVGVD